MKTSTLVRNSCGILAGERIDMGRRFQLQQASAAQVKVFGGFDESLGSGKCMERMAAMKGGSCGLVGVLSFFWNYMVKSAFPKLHNHATLLKQF